MRAQLENDIFPVKGDSLVSSMKGFTLIELIITLFLASTGFLAMIAMNSIQNQLLTQERDMTIARVLADSFIAELRGESTNWTGFGDFDPETTPFLYYGIEASSPGEWLALPDISGMGSPRFNSLGIPESQSLSGAQLDPRNERVNTFGMRYCIHYNLEFVGEESYPDQLLRAQIRVFWPTNRTSFGSDGVNDCGASDPATMASNRDQFRYLQQSAVLYQHTI
jgi:prepilin-type N-terminal cleavage/methylation domain-containing protein